MFNKNRLVLAVLVLALAFLLLAGCAAPANKQLTIATASMGGAYYPIGTGIAEIVTKSSEKGVKMTAEVTGGAVENCRLVGKKEADVGITNGNLAYFAYTGTDQYKEKYDILAMGAFHPTILHIMVLDSSPIKSVADLKGKRVAVGPAGGGSLPMFDVALAAYGLKVADIKPSYVSYEDGMIALKDGNVDAALAGAGYPTSGVMQLANTNKVRFVDVDEDKMAEINKKYPYYTKVVVDKSVYKTDKDGVVVGVNNVLFVHKDMNADIAYDITKQIYNNLEQLATFHASVKQVKLATAADVPIPLHPGAEKYFKEKGLTIKKQ